MRKRDALPSGVRTIGRCPATQRNIKELLRLRGHLLTGEDRALIEMHLEGGETIRRMATLADVTPSCIARRLAVITERLTDPTYALCLAQRRQFTRQELRIARDYFVRGHSIRRICQERDASRHRVRATIGKARELAAAATHPAEERTT
jgi:transposase-like protein